MSDYDKNLTPPQDEQPQDPFIPPGVLLGLSLLGFGVALVVAFTQPTFNVIGYGGLAFGVLAFIAWVLLAPRQASGALTGRTARFGGTSLLVTVLLIVGLAAVYVLVRNQGIRVDLTQTDTYSLTDESKQAMTAYGLDPSAPPVRLLAFYTGAQASSRDRDTALFDDYVANAGGKLSYEFIDPDRNPEQANLYGITRPGQIAVVAENDDGTLDTENAAIVSAAIQQDLTNAVLRTAAQGAFVAYFVTVRDGQGDQMAALKDALETRYDWTIVDASLAELTSPNAENPLNDPNNDGEVMIIPGGSAALSPEELQIVQDYLNNGGNVVLFAGSNLNDTQTSLATDTALNAYLASTFGLEINPSVVLDFTQAFQSPLRPVTTNLNTSAYITTAGVPRGQGALIFETPNTITVSDAPPADVTVTTLAQTTEAAYTIDDLNRIISGDDTTVAQAEGDATGPFVLATQAEHAATGARLVVFTSTSIGTDAFSVLNVDNLTVAFNSLVWTTDFSNFVSEVTVPQQTRPQDAPVFASEQDLRNISFLTLVVLPFGILGLGVYVWWSNRQRGRVRVTSEPTA